jgi:hypothetical protein
MQGRRVVWRGGETIDVVGTLTERLDDIRRARGLMPFGDHDRKPIAD